MIQEKKLGRKPIFGEEEMATIIFVLPKSEKVILQKLATQLSRRPGHGPVSMSYLLRKGVINILEQWKQEGYLDDVTLDEIRRMREDSQRQV